MGTNIRGIKNLKKSTDEYNRYYSDFGGADISGARPDEKERFEHIVNMYRDYSSSDVAAVETFPGFRRLADLGGRINGIFPYSSNGNSYIAVHSGTKLYRFLHEERDNIGSALEVDGLADFPSQAFAANGMLYILDGENYWKFDGNSLCAVTDDPYIPLTFRNGVQAEQRNMLVDKARESFVLNSDNFSEAISGTDGIRFSVGFTGVTIIGYEGDESLVRIPDSFEILGNEYPVEKIGASAFKDNTIIKAVIIPPKCSVEEEAFCGCTGLKYVAFEHFSDENVTQTIGKRAFFGSGINQIYLVSNVNADGEHSLKIEEEAFGNISKFSINISCDKDELEDLVSDELVGVVIRTSSVYQGIYYKISLMDKTERITDVVCNGEQVPFARSEDDKGRSAVILHGDTLSDIMGKEYTVFEDLKPDEIVSPEDIAYFQGSVPSYKGSGKDAIRRCRKAVIYDGRVFMSCNPDLPNTVFWSQNDIKGYCDPGYFGVYNFENDGMSDNPNVAMVKTGYGVMVFKQEGSYDESVYFHKAERGEHSVIQKIYPKEKGCTGVGCSGAASMFGNNPVYVSENGLELVKLKYFGNERVTEHRSSLIDILLLREDLSRAELCEWNGYMCLLVDGHMYLADSRQSFKNSAGIYEYEWYYIDSLGTYMGQSDRYHLVTVSPHIEVGEEKYPLDSFYVFNGGEYRRLERSDTRKYVPDGMQVSFNEIYILSDDGYIPIEHRVYVMIKDGRYFIADTDGEQSGGVFSPAIKLAENQGVLYFGTESGSLCCVNTDKRGEAQTVGGELDMTDPDRIHRDFYTFDGRRYYSGIVTLSDDCGLPHMRKKVIRGSEVILMKSYAGSEAVVMTRSDDKEWKPAMEMISGVFSLGGVEFDNIDFGGEIVKAHRPRKDYGRWGSRQYYIYSEGYKSPFGVYGISYCWRIAGFHK